MQKRILRGDSGNAARMDQLVLMVFDGDLFFVGESMTN